MQTDSLLTNLDRARLDRWAGDLERNKTYWHLGQQLAEIARPIVVELARLEQENQRLRSELEKPHEHSPKIKERQNQLILNGILERMSTLEGRVRGTMEGAKARLDSQESRLSALEEKVNRPNLVQEMTDLQNKQPVQTARNPFEDLRPPRGL